MSKLCYLIQLWGGCEGYLQHALQVVQNQAARAVTGRSWFTPTRVLFTVCNWPSVKQLIEYHTLIMPHKITMTRNPYYLKNKFSTDFYYRTRQVATGSIGPLNTELQP